LEGPAGGDDGLLLFCNRYQETILDSSEAWALSRLYCIIPVDFYGEHSREGCRCLAFMMLDADVAAVSPSSVWRVLRDAGLLHPWNGKASKKGTGFHQPEKPYDHWHIDVSCLNICGTFYYLCGVLDGLSRAIVHWEIRESMTGAEIELILQRAREKHPGATPRIISDNGPQFIARDSKEFIRISGMTRLKTLLAHNPKGAGSNPAPATCAAAAPTLRFVLQDLRKAIRMGLTFPGSS
jgi:hypothetical protein